MWKRLHLSLSLLLFLLLPITIQALRIVPLESAQLLSSPSLSPSISIPYMSLEWEETGDDGARKGEEERRIVQRCLEVGGLDMEDERIVEMSRQIVEKRVQRYRQNLNLHNQHLYVVACSRAMSRTRNVQERLSRLFARAGLHATRVLALYSEDIVLVSMSPMDAHRVMDVEYVEAMSVYPHSFRISPRLLEKMANSSAFPPSGVSLVVTLAVPFHTMSSFPSAIRMHSTGSVLRISHNRQTAFDSRLFDTYGFRRVFQRHGGLISYEPGSVLEERVFNRSDPAGREFETVVITCHSLSCVQSIVDLPLVAFVEEKLPILKLDQFANSLAESGVSSLPLSTPLASKGLRGDGEIGTVGDSGLDYDSCFFIDPNAPSPPPSGTVNLNRRKVVAYQIFPPADGQDDADGHGTHVAGIMTGNCIHSSRWQSNYNGIAPNSKLYVQDFGRAGSSGLSIPTNVELFFGPSFHAGAMIHSDSWGTDENAYTSLSRNVDLFVYNNPDFLPVFAVGNAGGAGPARLFSPSTSKNCLSVGASESSVLYISGSNPSAGMNVETSNTIPTSKGLLWSDPCSPPTGATQKIVIILAPSSGCTMGQQVSWSSSAGATGIVIISLSSGLTFSGSTTASIPVIVVSSSSQSQLTTAVSTWNADLTIVTNAIVVIPQTSFHPSNLAFFSSTGPTSDGRIKPDIVAPGFALLSAESTGNIDFSRFQCGVKINQGTSMATPLVSGAALIVRQYFRTGWYPTFAPVNSNGFVPSAALIKAVLINSAVELTGSGSAGSIPNFSQGFGRIQLASSLPVDGPSSPVKIIVFNNLPIMTDVERAFCFDLDDTNRHLKVTLVWTDYPGTVGASRALINDLDLAVDSPDDITRWGNDRTESDRDSRNNVEQVFVTSLISGRYRTRILGRSVPQGPQNFALVIRGDVRSAVCNSTCPSNCNAQGQCRFGACLCDPAYTGESCSEFIPVFTFGGSMEGKVLSSQTAFLRFLPSGGSDGRIWITVSYQQTGGSGQSVVRLRSGTVPSSTVFLAGMKTLSENVFEITAEVSSQSHAYVSITAQNGNVSYTLTAIECLSCRPTFQFCQDLTCQGTLAGGMSLGILVIIFWILAIRASFNQVERNKMYILTRAKEFEMQRISPPSPITTDESGELRPPSYFDPSSPHFGSNYSSAVTQYSNAEASPPSRRLSSQSGSGLRVRRARNVLLSRYDEDVANSVPTEYLSDAGPPPQVYDPLASLRK